MHFDMEDKTQSPWKRVRSLSKIALNSLTRIDRNELVTDWKEKTLQLWMSRLPCTWTNHQL